MGHFRHHLSGQLSYIWGGIDIKTVAKSLMPNTFAANWYVTCYLLFYPIHTILNSVIHKMGQVRLFRAASALGILYIGFDFIKGSLFFPSSLILWVAVYFIVAYIKIYLKGMASDVKINAALLCLGILGHLGIILATNFLGLRVAFFSDKLLHWANNCNPFILLAVMALFHLARNARFKSKFINGISSLSLLIYVIHENIIFRTYARPYLVNYVYEKYGYSHVLLWMLLLSVLIFVGTALLSQLYVLTLRRFVEKLSETVGSKCWLIWLRLENVVMKKSNTPMDKTMDCKNSRNL